MENNNFLLSLLGFIVIFQLSNGQDYCHIPTCGNKRHTMCSYPTMGPSESCTGLQESELLEEEKGLIVNMHNELRQRVASGRETRGNPGPQPAAANMQDLEWDEELADIAQRWTWQCEYGYDECRDVGRFPVGQNIVLLGTEGNNEFVLDDIILDWYDEVDDYNASDVNNYTSEINHDGDHVSHYTQLVWAESNKIGCGVVDYNFQNLNTTYFVCNYGPAGNVVGQSVYKIV